MGQHKTNPNSILKAQGKLAPKPKKKKESMEEKMNRFLKHTLWKGAK